MENTIVKATMPTMSTMNSASIRGLVHKPGQVDLEVERKYDSYFDQGRDTETFCGFLNQSGKTRGRQREQWVLAAASEGGTLLLLTKDSTWGVLTVHGTYK